MASEPAMNSVMFAPLSPRPPMLRSPLRPLLVLAVGAVALAACDSDAPSDSPLAEAEANLGVWTWIDVEGSQCRDGSATGIGVRLQEGAEDLMIYLEGGGACFNGATCATNPSSFGEAEFSVLAAQRSEAGIFSMGAENPVGDWNMVYVPYCTGDIHGGNAPNTTVQGVTGTQQFVGHQNVERALELLDDHFRDDPETVLLTGASAGGFGTLVNFTGVADRFAASEHVLLNDSGPIFFDDDVFSPLLGLGFNAQWNLAASFPADAAPLFTTDALPGVYAYLADRYPDARFGLASHLEDQVIRGFFSFGQADQTITGSEYAAGLRDLRAQAPADWATYFATGNDHVFIGLPNRYTGTSAGVALNDWVGDLIDGTASNVDPSVATVAAR